MSSRPGRENVTQVMLGASWAVGTSIALPVIRFDGGDDALTQTGLLSWNVAGIAVGLIVVLIILAWGK